MVQLATGGVAPPQSASGDVAPGWIRDVERGPDWLFITLNSVGEDPSQLAESVWSLVQQHFTYRLVLDCQRVKLLSSTLIAQLLTLEQRLHAHGGLLRLCALSEPNQRVLQQCRLAGRFPRFCDRVEAVLGHRPLQPR
jgi:anti-anti-sigma factor